MQRGAENLSCGHTSDWPWHKGITDTDLWSCVPRLFNELRGTTIDSSIKTRLAVSLIATATLQGGLRLSRSDAVAFDRSCRCPHPIDRLGPPARRCGSAAGPVAASDREASSVYSSSFGGQQYSTIGGSPCPFRSFRSLARKPLVCPAQLQTLESIVNTRGRKKFCACPPQHLACALIVCGLTVQKSHASREHWDSLIAPAIAAGGPISLWRSVHRNFRHEQQPTRII